MLPMGENDDLRLAGRTTKPPYGSKKDVELRGQGQWIEDLHNQLDISLQMQ